MTQRLHTKNTNQTLLDSFHTARACHQRGDLAGAEALYGQLLGIDPADDEVLFLFGALRAARGDLAAGLECIALAQSLNPSDSLMPYTQGVLLQQAGRLREACVAYQRCLGLQPRHQAALENLAAAHYELDEFEAGLACARKAQELAPESRLAIRAVANCLTALGRRAEALAVLDQGVALYPANPELHIHHAWELMANGDFDAGLREHEWRNLGALGAENNARQVPFPRWQGEALAGKTVLVYGEAGIGDELMCAPCVRALLEAGAQCIVECEPRLVPLFARALPGCHLLPRREQAGIDWDTHLASVDVAISSMSLPAHVSSPLQGAPFLRPDPERARVWREQLAALGPGLKVGVSWRGGANPKARALRSIAPALFGDLLVPGTHFISLQYGASAEECAQVSPALLQMADVDALRDLEEFSALIAGLDLVISVDNSTVHFAAALGVPTWLLLPRYAEWRWGRNEADAARWYPGLRFFPQAEAGEAGWRAVIAQAGNALAEFIAPPRAALAPLPAAIDPCLPAPAPGPRALLIGDTAYWYHWGCSCTSLGLHQGLRASFTQIAILPLSQILIAAPRPTSMADLQGDAFYSAFQSGCAGMLEKMAAADAIFINGEGSIHGSGPAALALLYLAYVAKVRLGKVVRIVNHSCYPGSGLMPDRQTPTKDFYACVYRAIDLAVLREKISFEQVQALGGKAILGFDCLPLFLESTGICRAEQASRKIVFGGSVAWTPALVEHFAALAARLAGQGYAIEILSGAKAYLADDEVGFVGAFSRALAALGVPHELRFALSEREWLQVIADAALVVSGRFHYSIAAAFLQVPFLVAESNTAKIAGLLDALGLSSDRVSVSAAELPQLQAKAAALLANPGQAIAADACLTDLRQRARCNFDFAPIAPVMLRAYNNGKKGATAFFRNRPFLETFCRLLRASASAPYRVLVHASSVGAEPWSLALWWLHRVLPVSGCDIEIFATDIDPGFLGVAEQGVYPLEILSGMTPEEQGWFERDGNQLRIPAAARERVRFLPPMSFVEALPEQSFDAVLIMNALTYVTPAEQSLVLARIAAHAPRVLGLTAFHPDTIRADLRAIGFKPCLENHREIHEAWGDRLCTQVIEAGSPEYSWQLPPYDTECPDAEWRFASLFVREA